MKWTRGYQINELQISVSINTTLSQYVTHVHISRANIREMVDTDECY